MQCPFDLRVELAPRHKAGLPIRSPLMLASGCAGFGDVPLDLMQTAAVGALVTLPIGTRSRHGRDGAIVEVPGGAVLVGQPMTLSASTLLRRYANVWRTHDIPVIVRLSSTVPDWARVAETIGSRPQVVGIECDLGSMPLEEAAAAVADLVAHSELPVLARIPCTSGTELAVAASESGADAFVIGGPVGAVAWSQAEERFVTGELAGSGTFPMALMRLRELRAVLSRPVVVGCGMYMPRQAVEALLAGAAAVQVGVAFLSDPTLPGMMLEAVRAEMEARGLTMISELVGREAG